MYNNNLGCNYQIRWLINLSLFVVVHAYELGPPFNNSFFFGVCLPCVFGLYSLLKYNDQKW